MEVSKFYYYQKTFPELRVFWEHLEEISDAVVLLQKQQKQQAAQWDVITTEQKQHCDDLASIYQQLQELLILGSCGYNNSGSSNINSDNNNNNNTRLKQERSDAKNVLEESLKNEICELLQNFKHHIKEHIEKTNQRLDAMQKYMESVQQSAGENSCLLAQQEERLARLENRQQQLQQSVSLAATKEDVDGLREALSRQLRSQAEESLLALQRHDAGVNAKFTKSEAQRREEQDSIRRGAAESAGQAAQLLAAEVKLLRQELRAQAAVASEETCAAEERTVRHVAEALRAHAAQTHQQINTAQCELDGKYSQRVGDTMNAFAKLTQIVDGLPQKVSLLEDNVGSIHSTLQHHGEVLAEHCLQGSLRGAFDEVKDWLQDLEQRILTHGEFDEIIATIEKKIAALRREFIMCASNGHARNDDIDKKRKLSQS